MNARSHGNHGHRTPPDLGEILEAAVELGRRRLEIRGLLFNGLAGIEPAHQISLGILVQKVPHPQGFAARLEPDLRPAASRSITSLPSIQEELQVQRIMPPEQAWSIGHRNSKKLTCRSYALLVAGIMKKLAGFRPAMSQAPYY